MESGLQFEKDILLHMKSSSQLWCTLQGHRSGKWGESEGLVEKYRSCCRPIGSVRMPSSCTEGAVSSMLLEPWSWEDGE